MADLIAQGSEPEHRWRRSLVEDCSFEIGRQAGTWSTPWDEFISRRQAALRWKAGRLEVSLLAGARSPIFYLGKKTERFTLSPGEHFVIANTTFSLVDAQLRVAANAPRPLTEQTFERHELRRASFRHPDQRIAALSRLPDIISSSVSESELFSRLVGVLMSGISWAKGVAFIECTAQSLAVRVLHWDQRTLTGEEFLPSERLIQQAVESAASVVHVWNAKNTAVEFTARSGVDWAFCTPLMGRGCQGQALYVSGTFPEASLQADPESLRDDLKFAELAATTFSRLRDAQNAERRLAGLSQFLSPVVLGLISESDIETVLAPREANLTVLFCDMRGFSRIAEQASSRLLELLERVSLALGVMTRHILAHGGVVGDFHGDSSMGFWGWPFDQPDAALRACRAALAIRAEFDSASASGENALGEFQVGIGIATGRAVAGKIGSRDQVKVTAFGPVLNLAARLESLTKIIYAPIALDEATAEILRVTSTDEFRLRRVARIRPWGVSNVVEVTELLPRDVGPSAEQLRDYEAALEAIARGDWAMGQELAQQLASTDPVAYFLLEWLARYHHTPPQDWRGVYEALEK